MALFLTNYLIAHNKLIEPQEYRELLLNAHVYMIKISQVEDREIFKICLDYWSKLVQELYEEIQNLPIGESGLLMGLSLGGPGGNSLLSGFVLRKDIYMEVLSNLRLVMVERMAKPEEVSLDQILWYTVLTLCRYLLWRTMKAKSCERPCEKSRLWSSTKSCESCSYISHTWTSWIWNRFFSTS